MAKIHLIYDPSGVISRQADQENQLGLKIAVVDVREDFLQWPGPHQDDLIKRLADLLIRGNAK